MWEFTHFWREPHFSYVSFIFLRAITVAATKEEVLEVEEAAETAEEAAKEAAAEAVAAS